MVKKIIITTSMFTILRAMIAVLQEKGENYDYHAYDGDGYDHDLGYSKGAKRVTMKMKFIPATIIVRAWQAK